VIVDTADERDAARIWNDVLLACHLLETALERQAQRDGDIAHGHMQILTILRSRLDCTMTLTELAQTLRFSLSRTSHAITALGKQGIVDRRAVDGDRRSTRVLLTPEGIRLVDRMLEHQQRELRDPLFDDLGPERVRVLGEFVQHAIAALDTAPQEGTTP
jgi:DNA-binding MarR family transcriptional regulator